jgi:dihydroflavonol-4-reductase
MKVLVTGATGFLGGHLARLLVKRGETVRALVRPSNDGRVLDGLPVERVSGDLRDAESIERAVQGAEVIYHVAADYRLWARDPGEIYAANVGGARNLLVAARRAKVTKIVYTSTVATFAVPRADSLPNESTAATLAQMIGHYKRSKWQAEQEVLQAAREGLPITVVNPTTPVGPGDAKPTPTGRIILDFLRGRMPAYVDTGLNFVPVEDVAAGHILAAELGKPGERYILGGENLSLKQALHMLAQVSSRPAPRVRLPHVVALAAGYMDAARASLLGVEPRIPLEGVRMSRHNMFVDDSKARRELGFASASVQAALQRAVQWYEANGYVSGCHAVGAPQAHAA